MAIYRQLHTTFWKDKRVGEWSKDQKLFFLYLLSNDYTTQCGVYEFNIRYARFELDMTTEEIKQHIDFLVSEGRIVFNEKSEELMIVNWLKYNSARSPKVAPVIDKELKEIKTLEFELEVIKKCIELGYPIKTIKPKENTISVGYQYGMDTVTQPSPSSASTPSSTPTTASASTSDAQKPAAAASANPFELYQQEFGIISPLIQQDIAYWIDDLDEEMVCEAMKRASLKQASYNYAKGIMTKWAKSNIRTMDDVMADDVKHEKSKVSTPYKKQPTRTEALPSWYGKEQPTGDEKEIQLDADIEARFEAYQARKAAQSEANDTDTA